MERILALKEKIISSANAYYNGDSPIITDEEFDALVEQLRSLCPADPLLSTPGWGVNKAADHLAKFKHGSLVEGLNQVKIGYLESGNKLADNEEVNGYVVSSKLDGIAVVLYYGYDGEFIRALTRHDGIYGLDITVNLRYASFPRKVANGIKEVRGEITISDEDFQTISDEYSNQRNAASGIACAKYQSPELGSKLRFVAYSLTAFYEDVPQESWVGNYSMLLLCLVKSGFEVVKHVVVPKSRVENFLIFNPPSQFKDESCPYLMDGLVVGSVEMDWDLEMHGTNKVHLKIKYQSEIVETEVTKIWWQVSGYGRVVPTVEFKSVNLGGVNVSYASGFNAEYIKTAGINVGAKIKVSRRNEVIPHIEEVVERKVPEIPEFVDGKSVYWEGVHIRIKTDMGPSVIRTLIVDFGPKGLGGTIVNKFMEESGLTCISQLADIINTGPGHEVFSKSTLYPGQLSLVQQSFFFMKEKETHLDYALQCTWTDGMGWSTANKIAAKVSRDEVIQVLSSGDYIRHLGEDTLSDKESIRICDDIIKSCSGSVAGNIAENSDTILKVLELPFKWTAAKVQNLVTDAKFKISLTGKLSRPRGDLIKEWIPLGVVETGIREAQYLVCDKRSESSKFKAAEAKGVVIITESDFRNLIGA